MQTAMLTILLITAASRVEEQEQAAPSSEVQGETTNEAPPAPDVTALPAAAPTGATGAAAMPPPDAASTSRARWVAPLDEDEARWAQLGVGCVVACAGTWLFQALAGMVTQAGAAAIFLAAGGPSEEATRIANGVGYVGLAVAAAGIPAAGALVGVSETWVADQHGPRRAAMIWPALAGAAGMLVGGVGGAVGLFGLGAYALTPIWGGAGDPMWLAAGVGGGVVGLAGLALGIWGPSLAYDLTAVDKEPDDDGSAPPGVFVPRKPREPKPYVPRSTRHD